MGGEKAETNIRSNLRLETTKGLLTVLARIRSVSFRFRLRQGRSGVSQEFSQLQMASGNPGRGKREQRFFFFFYSRVNAKSWRGSIPLPARGKLL